MTVKTDNIQIGNNPTATQNFTLKQGADGTCTLARGNVGATTQDILTVDAAGKVTFPLPPIQTQYSMVRLNTANGYGSTNTVIRRFTNVVTNVGSDITYADSATLGASFTINTNGVYGITYLDSFSAGADNLGLTLNSAQLTTSIMSTTISDRLATTVTGGVNSGSTLSTQVYLTSGSIIRAHSAGGSAGSVTALFTITRVG